MGETMYLFAITLFILSTSTIPPLILYLIIFLRRSSLLEQAHVILTHHIGDLLDSDFSFNPSISVLKMPTQRRQRPYSQRADAFQSTLIHQAARMTPTMHAKVRIAAPALSLVVITESVKSCVADAVSVEPALGSLTDVPPVEFVMGAVAAVARFVPRTLSADICRGYCY